MTQIYAEFQWTPVTSSLSNTVSAIHDDWNSVIELAGSLFLLLAFLICGNLRHLRKNYLSADDADFRRVSVDAGHVQFVEHRLRNP